MEIPSWIKGGVLQSYHPSGVWGIGLIIMILGLYHPFGVGRMVFDYNLAL
jgi:hypothetical protein